MREDETPRIEKVEPENRDVTSLYVAGVDPERFGRGRPGQFATIRVKTDTGWSEPHPFTITEVSGDTVRFTIKRAGEFTGRVRDLPPGTPVRCAGPFGEFCADIASRADILFVAGGVGITPFLSVLRHFRREKATNRMSLVWANKTPEDLFATAELAAMRRELDLRLAYVFSRVEASDRVEESHPEAAVRYGRVGREVLAEFMPGDEASVYLCGPPGMQQSVLDELASLGVPPERVQREAFVHK